MRHHVLTMVSYPLLFTALREVFFFFSPPLELFHLKQPVRQSPCSGSDDPVPASPFLRQTRQRIPILGPLPTVEPLRSIILPLPCS